MKLTVFAVVRRWDPEVRAECAVAEEKRTGGITPGPAERQRASLTQPWLVKRTVAEVRVRLGSRMNFTDHSLCFARGLSLGSSFWSKEYV